MSVRFGKDAGKALDRAFRTLGARRERMRHGTQYTFADGAVKLVPHNVRPHVAQQMVAEVEARYGRVKDRPSYQGVKVAKRDAPRVDLKRVRVTAHALDRRAQMEDQDDLTTAEIAVALTAPSRIEWHPTQRSYAFVGDRVAVAGCFDNGYFVIRTFLWTTDDLWERNPRPEKELTA